MFRKKQKIEDTLFIQTINKAIKALRNINTSKEERESCYEVIRNSVQLLLENFDDIHSLRHLNFIIAARDYTYQALDEYITNIKDNDERIIWCYNKLYDNIHFR